MTLKDAAEALAHDESPQAVLVALAGELGPLQRAASEAQKAADRAVAKASEMKAAVDDLVVRLRAAAEAVVSPPVANPPKREYRRPSGFSSPTDNAKDFILSLPPSKDTFTTDEVSVGTGMENIKTRNAVQGLIRNQFIEVVTRGVYRRVKAVR